MKRRLPVLIFDVEIKNLSAMKLVHEQTISDGLILPLPYGYVEGRCLEIVYQIWVYVF